MGRVFSCWESQNTEKTPMNNMILRLYVKLQDLMSREEGQDLVEYALVLAVIALGSVAAMKSVATSISTEFSVMESIFSSAA
jgi:pilus assembly protein Flp/PilA